MKKTKLTEICGQWKRFDGLLTEFQRSVVLFRIFACVLFTMVENSNVGLRFQRMTCSTPTNPFKPEKPLTPATDSSLDPKVNFQSPIRQIHPASLLASERFAVKHFIDAVQRRRRSAATTQRQTMQHGRSLVTGL